MIWRDELKEFNDKTNEVINAEQKRYIELQKKYDDTVNCHAADLKSRDETCDASQQKLEDIYEQRLCDKQLRVETLQQQMKSLQHKLEQNLAEEASLCNSKIKEIHQTAGSEEVKLRNQLKKLQEESVHTLPGRPRVPVAARKGRQGEGLQSHIGGEWVASDGMCSCCECKQTNKRKD